jgi:flagellar hook-associated protein 1 FlgK
VTGVPLFAYDATNDATVARTLAVNGAMAPDQLAAIDPGPPYVSNGIALKLANLAAPHDSADMISDMSYVEYYGELAARVGRKLQQASSGLDLQKQLVAQSRSLREEISGVSLDEEAVYMLEFQRAYQATARLITVLDELTETTVNLIR